VTTDGLSGVNSNRASGHLTITELSHMNKKPRFASKIIQFLIIVVPSLGLAPQDSQGGVILQLHHDPHSRAQFPWNWEFIKQHVDQIRAAGYTAILISPHQKSCGISKGYNPEDFTSFNSSHGSLNSNWQTLSNQSWRNTSLHDYSFHVEDKWTNEDGYVEAWIPPMSYVMLAPQ
jgi:hypothetical protein